LLVKADSGWLSEAEGDRYATDGCPPGGFEQRGSMEQTITRQTGAVIHGSLKFVAEPSPPLTGPNEATPICSGHGAGPGRVWCKGGAANVEI
jgi:hypothetical protein